MKTERRGGRESIGKEDKRILHREGTMEDRGQKWDQIEAWINRA